jgi:polysaccharide export outer membrane protein
MRLTECMVPNVLSSVDYAEIGTGESVTRAAIVGEVWVTIIAIGLGAATLTRVAGADTDPPSKELIQYVRDAKRHGLKETNIKKNALAGGWPAAVVDEAIAYVKQGPTSEAAVLTRKSPAGLQNSSSSNPSQTPQPNRPESAVDIPKNRGVPEDYVIGAGDILQIAVWKEPDASVPSVVVRPDGKIAMPLLKEVEVVGMTPARAEQVITEKLVKFINGPDVTVVVTEINSKKVYVVGAARKEGPLSYAYRMSVMQAISEAGGLNDYAKRKKIYVLRNEGGKDYRLPFNYDEVIKGEKMEQNIQLLPGDTLVIPH